MSFKYKIYSKEMDELRNLLKNHNIQIFTISEPWLNDTITDNVLSINGYQHFRQDRLYKSNKNSTNA